MIDKEKSLVKTHTSIFTKIKNILINIFKPKRMSDDNKIHTSTSVDKDFKRNIRIKQNKEENRLLIVQQWFKDGKVYKIKHDDYKQLLKLYDKQNEELRKEIEVYKQETAKILKEMKN